MQFEKFGSCQVGGGGAAPPPVKVEPAKEETSNDQPPNAAQVIHCTIPGVSKEAI